MFSRWIFEKKKLNHKGNWILRDDSKIEDHINLETKKAVSSYIFDSKTIINIVNKIYLKSAYKVQKIYFEIITGKPT